MKLALTSFVAVIFAASTNLDAGIKLFKKHRPVGGGLVLFPHVHNYVATPHSAYLHGKADVIRSTGFAIESVTRGAINVQIARNLKLDNDTKSVEERWKQRKIWRENFNQEHRVRRARVQTYLANYKSSAPKPFTMDDCNEDGELEWPTALKSTTFDYYRTKLQRLFVTRATADVPGVAKQIELTVKAFQLDIDRHRGEMTMKEYFAAVKFVKRLAAS